MKTKLKVFFLIQISFVFFSAKGQNITYFNTANTSTTLCNNYVRTIVEDPAGVKWIGTNAGVSRYDGINWTTYTTEDGLVSNLITSVCIDTPGNIWFASYEGISKFDGINFTNYVNIKNIKSIAVDSSNNIWAGSLRTGVVKFDGTNWTTYTVADGLADYYIEDIAIDKKGVIWVTSNHGYSTFDGINWTAHRSDLPNSPFPYNAIRSIYIDSEGNKWFGANEAIGKLSGTNWTTFPTTITHNDEWCHVVEIKGDSGGNIWAGSIKNGVSRFDGINWLNIKKEDGILDNYIGSILIDKQDSAWLCTAVGISVGVNDNWRSLRGNGLINNSINSITEVSNGDIWSGTNGGLSIYNGSNWNNVYDSVSNIRKMAYDSNNENLWVATSNGVFKYDSIKWSHYTTENSQINTNNIIDFAIDKNNNKWFLTIKGISVYNGISWINSKPDIDSILFEYPKSIEVDSNNHKWIITRNSISKFDDLAWTNYSSINNSFILKTAIDSIGKIWIAANNGIYLKNYDSWIKYNIQNTRSVFVDKYENAWIGTNDSIFLYRNNTWYKFNKNDVLQGIGGFSALIADNKKNIWIGGLYGIAVLDSAYVSDSAISTDAISTTDMHVVDFVVNEVSSFKGVYSHGNSISKLTMPIKEGYVLSGWYKEAGQLNEWDFETDVVVSPDTLYAQWNITTYRVTFAALFGGSIPYLNAEYNTLISAPEIPIRKGYTFTGWYKEANHINKWNFATDSVMKNITLYANWTINTYTVKFQDEDGMVSPDTLVTYYTLLKEPTEPIREGYIFLNWYKEAELINSWDFGKDLVLENTTLYAKWLNISSAADEQSISTINLYPNPAGSTLFLSNLPQKFEIFIFSSTGKLVLQSKMKEGESTLDIQELANGTYLFILTSKTESFKGKFVKQ